MEQNLDLNQLMKLARSPAGQQLLQLLQQQGGQELEAAAKKASAGDFVQAMQALSGLLSTPEAKAILKELEDRK